MKNNKVQYLPIRARSKDESEVLDLYLVIYAILLMHLI